MAGMPRIDPGTLWKRTATKAAASTGNVVSGATALAASAVLWNPLPLILWGLGSAGYVLYATTSEKHLKKVMDEEKAVEDAAAVNEREAQRRSMEMLFDASPFADWIRLGVLPDYASEYGRLLGMRNDILKLAHERQEVELVTELGLRRQLDYMLGAFLQFARARAAYLRILSTVPAASQDSAPAPPPPPKLKGQPRVHNLPPPPLPPMSALPDLDRILSDLNRKIEGLKLLAEKEPASAKARLWHVGILEKQKDLVKECGQRDQAVCAQLEAFGDAFAVVLGRVSAAQFDAGEVQTTMDAIVTRVEETERFVKAFAPTMDQMLSGLDTGAQPA